MTTKRIIPCLDIRDGRVVKGVKFQDVQDVEDPVSLARYYNESGADELVFYDITASFEQRKLFTDVLERTAQEVFIPLTVGGNINTVEDFERVLHCGADKVSVNTGALRDPALLERAAKKYGAQCVVLSMDVKRVDHQYCVFSKGGRENTGKDALQWAAYGAEHGAGELVINSIDTDGVRDGFDLPLLAEVCARVRIPVIASGGAGNMQHFAELFRNVPDVDAGLAASIFHFKEVNINELKRYLMQQDINVRISE